MVFGFGVFLCCCVKGCRIAVDTHSLFSLRLFVRGEYLFFDRVDLSEIWAAKEGGGGAGGE